MMLNSALRCILIAVVILALLTTKSNASNSRPPRNNDISNMADALKYLQDLDTYYGDRARVRFGKRMPWPQMMRNRIAPETGEIQPLHPADFSAVDEPF